MTKYYWAQMEDVIADKAEPSQPPAVCIHPAWTTNDVYHDLFFDPFGEGVHPTYWEDFLMVEKLRQDQRLEEWDNRVPAIKF